MAKKKIIYSPETLFRIVYDAKAQGKKIGLTHGAFDLFHYSHLDLLQKSAELCDFLIVGIDSNKSVSKYKSYKRPIIDEDWRMKIINELDCVSATFVKNTDLDVISHTDLYKELNIDILTIGQGDNPYEEEMKEEVSRVGAELVKLDTWQEHTTTKIIEMIVKSYKEDVLRDVPKSEF
ncbi:adenylyltransferase/cytidyltransferase family protein [Patescibacteria group bacterium]